MAEKLVFFKRGTASNKGDLGVKKIHSLTKRKSHTAGGLANVLESQPRNDNPWVYNTESRSLIKSRKFEKKNGAWSLARDHAVAEYQPPPPTIGSNISMNRSSGVTSKKETEGGKILAGDADEVAAWDAVFYYTSLHWKGQTQLER